MRKRLLFIFALILISSVSASLEVHSPVNGGIYGSRMVLFSLESSESSDFFYLKHEADQFSRWGFLCRNILVCEAKKRLAEGENSIQVRSVSSNESFSTQNISFFVDSVAPRISKTFPRNGLYVNGDDLFRVFYTEQNVVSTVLHLSENPADPSFLQTPLDCPSGRNQNCDYVSDESGIEIPNGDFYYWFEISDIAGRTVSSKRSLVHVDTTSPVYSSAEYIIDDDILRISLDIAELNFEGVYYLDHADSNPHYRKLCSRLEDGNRCVVSKHLRRGEHLFDVKVVDLAGNEATVWNGLEVNVN